MQWRVLVGIALVVSATALSHVAQGQVLALGASNTAGYGVGSATAFPTQLEHMLRARGFAVSVINAGVSGDTTAGMLSRVDSAVPSGTRIVLLDAGGSYFNNSRHGVNPQQGKSEVAARVGRLRQRGVVVIPVNGAGLPRGPDGIHWSAQTHGTVAAALVPQVAAALGDRRRP
jgi:acyl-CoA thioesterase-1